MKRRLLSIFLSLTMILSMVPSVWAADEMRQDDPAAQETETPAKPAMNGNCGADDSGDSVKWALTDDDGDGFYTLTISGSGAMANYTANINNEKRPHNPGEQVKQVLKSKRLPKWLCPKVLLLLVPSRLTA